MDGCAADLPKEHSISHLYEKMSQQIHDAEQLADKFPSAKETIQGSANSLSQNIEFMNQLSQMYSYVQVPIRLRGQNVNSELFVYRNGGRDKGADDELTAFYILIWTIWAVWIFRSRCSKKCICQLVLRGCRQSDAFGGEYASFDGALRKKGLHL